MSVVADFAALLACVGVLISFLGLAAVRRFAKPAHNSGHVKSGQLPPVTILKPLCGREPLLEEALLSSFTQIYPNFQIVFGVQDPSDPALEVVERLRRRFPNRDTEVVVNPMTHGANRKVSNLINMLPSAKHDIIVISDSDLHVPSNYLDRLVAELNKPGTGLVTALYVGVPAGGWVAALGATQISHHFLPGVLLSRVMGRQDCLGSTAMLQKDTLSRAGGLRALVELLAEDNLLGQRVRDLGLSIAIPDVVPAATVPEPSLAALWQHELRWARTIRDLAPASLGASILQYPLFWSVVALVLSAGAAWAIALFLCCWAARAICARKIDAALNDRVGRLPLATPFWLLPLRDVLSVIEIGASFWIDEVTWRGHRMDAGAATAKSANQLAVSPEQNPLTLEN